MFKSKFLITIFAVVLGSSTVLAQGKTILVVDDSATVRQQVRIALTKAGFIPVEATDGVDAMDKLLSVPSIALVICDVNMPRMNGIELIEKVRAEQRFSSIPFLMLTTEGQPTFVERAKKAGAKGWIVKPIKSDILISAVRRMVK